MDQFFYLSFNFVLLFVLMVISGNLQHDECLVHVRRHCRNVTTTRVREGRSGGIVVGVELRYQYGIGPVIVHVLSVKSFGIS